MIFSSPSVYCSVISGNIYKTTVIVPDINLFSRVGRGLNIYFQKIIMQGKGTAVSVQAWRGPEDSRRLRLPDFKMLDMYRWSYALATFSPPGNIPGTHFC